MGKCNKNYIKKVVRIVVATKIMLDKVYVVIYPT